MSDVAPRHQTPDPRPKTTVPSPVPMCEHAHILISSSYPAILPSFHPLSAEVRTSVLGSLSPAWHFFHIPAFRPSLRLWRDAAPQLALSLRLDLLLDLPSLVWGAAGTIYQYYYLCRTPITTTGRSERERENERCSILEFRKYLEKNGLISLS